MSKVKDIVRKAGGPVKVAAASARTRKPVDIDAVFKWYRNGIPSFHWPLLIGLANVTPQDLYDANEQARRARPRRRSGNEPRAAA